MSLPPLCIKTRALCGFGIVVVHHKVFSEHSKYYVVVSVMLLPPQSIFRMFKVLCRGMCNVLTHPPSKYSTYPLSSSLPYYCFPREYLLSEPIMLSKDIGLAFLQHKMSHLPFLLTKSTFSKKVHPLWSTLGPPFNELHQLMTNICFEFLVV